MRKEIGYIGLGKMGFAMAVRLQETGWNVAAFDLDKNAVAQARRKKIRVAEDAEHLAAMLRAPRIIWLMVPPGKPVDAVIQGISPFLSKGDIVIDGGNSFYEDSVRRGAKMAKRGISFVDVGVSGGPSSVQQGMPALMVGGEKAVFRKLAPLFGDLTKKESFGHMGRTGAGHFAKMVHNGIEYGMMQAMAEGFAVLKRSPFDIDVREAARVYNNGSVIQSRLTGWTEKGLKKFGQELQRVSGTVEHTGMGKWTAQTAKKLGVPAPIIDRSFRFRVESEQSPSYTGKVLMMLRHMFGGHEANPRIRNKE